MKPRIITMAVLGAGLMAATAWRGGLPVDTLAGHAQRFVTYYRAMENSDPQIGPWQRVLYSIALAGAPSAQGEAWKTARPQNSPQPSATF